LNVSLFRSRWKYSRELSLLAPLDLVRGTRGIGQLVALRGFFRAQIRVRILAIMAETAVATAQKSDVADRARLAELESVIARGKRAFIEVGKALAEIKRSRLYLLQRYRSFGDYCAKKWGISSKHGDRFVRAFELATRRIAAGLPAPKNERQARLMLEKESRARRGAAAPPPTIAGEQLAAEQPATIVNGHAPAPIVNGQPAVSGQARVNGYVQAPALPPIQRADAVPVVDDLTPRGFFSTALAEQIGQVLDQLKTMHAKHPEAYQLTEILRLYWSELCTKVPNGSLIRRAWL
jgi:hypothetical protein